MSDAAPAWLLEVEGLRKSFPVRSPLGLARGAVRAVDDVSFKLARGRTLGLVGESGCGKSTVARLILRLIDGDGGRIRFDGHEIQSLSERKLRPLRRQMQLVFQDPYASLNPRLSVGAAIEELLIVHGLGATRERRERVAEVLTRVGFRRDMAERYPHELSGGQRQRAAIARALVLNPKLIVADEPVSALDVSIQAQVLNLLADLQDALALSYVFVSHDLAVVEYISDDVAVMYLGRIVERAPTRELYGRPLHPYTQCLLEASPALDPSRRHDRRKLEGEVPSPIDPPAGCAFHPRCPYRMDVCTHVAPPLVEVAPGHWAACHLHPAAGEAATVARQEGVNV